MNIYRIDVPVFASAYIKAESEEDARKKVVEHLADNEVALEEGNAGDIEVYGGPFDSADFPEVSISPVMTIGDKDAINTYLSTGIAELVEEDA